MVTGVLHHTFSALGKELWIFLAPLRFVISAAANISARSLGLTLHRVSIYIDWSLWFDIITRLRSRTPCVKVSSALLYFTSHVWDMAQDSLSAGFYRCNLSSII